jgi:hypothetical protein
MFQTYTDSIKVATGAIAVNATAVAVPVTDKISGFISLTVQIVTGIATLVHFFKTHKNSKKP